MSSTFLSMENFLFAFYFLMSHLTHLTHLTLIAHVDYIIVISPRPFCPPPFIFSASVLSRLSL